MTSDQLLAYVGPGPGLTMVWAFVALLGTIGLAILSLLFWPIRMLIRKMRGGTPANVDNPAQGFEPTITPTPADPTRPAKSH